MPVLSVCPGLKLQGSGGNHHTSMESLSTAAGYQLLTDLKQGCWKCTATLLVFCHNSPAKLTLVIIWAMWRQTQNLIKTFHIHVGTADISQPVELFFQLILAVHMIFRGIL